MSEADSSASAASASSGTGEEQGQSKSSAPQDNNSAFECNICLDTARDAVVSYCGHLFCWPCLHQWLETRPARKTCPVCKAGIDKSKVVPLYGRGCTDQQDPRTKVPPRPQGQRSEPETSGNFGGFNFGDSGFQMSFGIGAFPFGFFASSFNLSDSRPGPPPQGSTQQMEERFLNKIFLVIAFVFMLWLIIA